MLLVAAAPLAALAFSSAPAAAESPSGFTGSPGPFDHWSALPTVHRGIPLDGRRHHGRRGRGRDTVVIVDGAGYYGGEWALYNNRGWESDSYNDWWHDRPDRAYPRWLQNNQNCDRMWWGGGAWRCSW